MQVQVGITHCTLSHVIVLANNAGGCLFLVSDLEERSTFSVTQCFTFLANVVVINSSAHVADALDVTGIASVANDVLVHNGILGFLASIDVFINHGLEITSRFKIGADLLFD